MKKLFLAIALMLGLATGYSQSIEPMIKTFTLTDSTKTTDSLRVPYGQVPVALMIDTTAAASEISFEVSFGNASDRKWYKIYAQAGYDSVYAVLCPIAGNNTDGSGKYPVFIPLDIPIMATILGIYDLNNSNVEVWIRLVFSVVPNDNFDITPRMRMRYL